MVIDYTLVPITSTFHTQSQYNKLSYQRMMHTSIKCAQYLYGICGSYITKLSLMCVHIIYI